MSDIELITQRRLTTAFIATQPIVVTLVPHTMTQTSTGGRVETPQTPRAPQTMRLIESTGVEALGDGVRVGEAGFERRVMHELLGEWDAIIEVHDRFTIPGDNGGDWDVTGLYHFNGWERRAMVTRRG